MLSSIAKTLFTLQAGDWPESFRVRCLKPFGL